MTNAAFWVLAPLAVLSAIGVVGLGKNPIHSALSLVLNLFILAMIYFTLGAQFLGITQIMVYLGGIMVLILFVLMILKLSSQRENEKQVSPSTWVLAAAGSAAVLLAISQALIQAIPSGTGITASEDWGTPQSIGAALFFSEYVWPFVIAGVLLTLGVVGSIMLAKRKVS